MTFTKKWRFENFKIQNGGSNIQKLSWPYWIRHFEFHYSERRFVISDLENPRVLNFKSIEPEEKCMF